MGNLVISKLEQTTLNVLTFSHRSTGQRSDPEEDSASLPSSFSPVRTLLRAGMTAAVRSATDDIKLVGSVLKHAITSQLQG